MRRASFHLALTMERRMRLDQRMPIGVVCIGLLLLGCCWFTTLRAAASHPQAGWRPLPGEDRFCTLNKHDAADCSKYERVHRGEKRILLENAKCSKMKPVRHSQIASFRISSDNADSFSVRTYYVVDGKNGSIDALSTFDTGFVTGEFYRRAEQKDRLDSVFIQPYSPVYVEVECLNILQVCSLRLEMYMSCELPPKTSNQCPPLQPHRSNKGVIRAELSGFKSPRTTPNDFKLADLEIQLRKPDAISQRLSIKDMKPYMLSFESGFQMPAHLFDSTGRLTTTKNDISNDCLMRFVPIASSAQNMALTRTDGVIELKDFLMSAPSAIREEEGNIADWIRIEVRKVDERKPIQIEYVPISIRHFHPLLDAAYLRHLNGSKPEVFQENRYAFMTLLESMGALSMVGEKVQLSRFQTYEYHDLRLLIVGPQNAGKSTFINTLINLFRPPPLDQDGRASNHLPYFQMINPLYNSGLSAANTVLVTEVPLRSPSALIHDAFMVNSSLVCVDTPGMTSGSDSDAFNIVENYDRLLDGRHPAIWDTTIRFPEKHKLIDQTLMNKGVDYAIFMCPYDMWLTPEFRRNYKALHKKTKERGIGSLLVLTKFDSAGSHAESTNFDPFAKTDGILNFVLNPSTEASVIQHFILNLYKRTNDPVANNVIERSAFHALRKLFKTRNKPINAKQARVKMMVQPPWMIQQSALQKNMQFAFVLMFVLIPIVVCISQIMQLLVAVGRQIKELRLAIGIILAVAAIGLSKSGLMDDKELWALRDHIWRLLSQNSAGVLFRKFQETLSNILDSYGLLDPNIHDEYFQRFAYNVCLELTLLSVYPFLLLLALTRTRRRRSEQVAHLPADQPLPQSARAVQQLAPLPPAHEVGQQPPPAYVDDQ